MIKPTKDSEFLSKLPAVIFNLLFFCYYYFYLRTFYAFKLNVLRIFTVTLLLYIKDDTDDMQTEKEIQKKKNSKKNKSKCCKIKYLSIK